MKGVRYLFTTLVIIGLFSCSKNKDLVSAPGIVGRWVSTAAYAEENGQFKWIETNGFREFLTLHADARFDIFTDVPGGRGTYFYNDAAGSLKLRFLDQTGGIAAEEHRTVESIDGQKMVIAYFSLHGQLLGKLAYERIN